MIQEWFDNNIFLYIILGICGVGLFIKFVLSMKYRLLIRASKRMGTSRNRLMRVLRLKFETCYKLNIGVNNVDTFVDKYVYRYKFCGFLLYTWETISGEIMIISVLAGSAFSVLGLLVESPKEDYLSTFIAGVLGALVLISYDHFINLNIKRKVLKVNIKDYLENFLKSRLENGEFSSDLLEQYKKEYLEIPSKKSRKKAKNEQNSETPDLVAQIESAATSAELIPSKDKISEKNRGLADDEFDDAKLFVEQEKGVDIAKAQEKHTKKEKPKKKLKPEEEAELRREAKKNELKKMIQEDKENRHITMPELFPIEPEKEKEKEVEPKESKSKVTSIVKSQEQSPFSRPVEKKRETEKSVQNAISKEEAQIIEDILREYLA